MSVKKIAYNLGSRYGGVSIQPKLEDGTNVGDPFTAHSSGNGSVQIDLTDNAVTYIALHLVSTGIRLTGQSFDQTNVNTNANQTELDIKAKTDLIGDSVATLTNVTDAKNEILGVINNLPVNGTGDTALTITVKDDQDNLVRGARLTLTENGYFYVTGNDGIARFNVNAGDYSAIVGTLPNYETPDEPLPITVPENVAEFSAEITLARISYEVPGQPGMVYVDVYTVDVIGQKVAGIPVTLTIRDKFVTFEGVVPTSFEQTINSDVNGRARFVAIPSSKVRPVTSISTHLVTIQGVIRYLIVSDSGGNAATMFRRT